MQYTLSTYPVQLADRSNQSIWFSCQAEDEDHSAKCGQRV